MKPDFNLDTSVQYLKSVGPARMRSLARLHIETIEHLLNHYPVRYHDRSQIRPIAQASPGPEVTVAGEILTAGERRIRRGGTIQTVSVGDDTGIVFCVWFNQRFLLKQFRAGKRVMLSGVMQKRQGRMQMAHPDFEFLSDQNPQEQAGQGASLNTGRLVPVYPLTSGVGQHWLRALVWQTLEKLEAGKLVPGLDFLPAELRRRHQLLPLDQALRAIHFPGSAADLAAARKTLVYRELFLIQILLALRRQVRQDQKGIGLSRPGDLTKRLVDSLPFALTEAQRRVLKDILADLRSGCTMHRLLQGDVGSGKTIVAFLAALFVIEQGYQGVLMAPTEVLARQHGHTLKKLAAPLGVTVEVLTGSTVAAERRAVLASVGAGECDLLVGTHSVIQDGVWIPRLALSIVDEQHRFGVAQRGQSSRRGESLDQAHVLVMSATPIPRSLALTLYGDLDLSLIDELPAGRQPITTRMIDQDEENKVWELCRQEIKAGHQVYVIYPVIEETEGQDLKDATSEHARLAGDVFSDSRVALLHGRLKPAEKNSIMAEFAAGKVDVLVATTVVEVGLDVPNATGMVIHHPERFGLAQLHQLRGRIGRGKDRSSCWLLVEREMAPESLERVRFFSRHLDGFDLAEEDLRRRGPGDVWGTRQHGAPGLRLANPIRDAELLKHCQEDARRFLLADPDLKSSSGKLLVEAMKKAFSRALPGHSG